MGIMFIEIIPLFISSCVQGDLYEDLHEEFEVSHLIKRTKPNNDFGDWRLGECATYALFNIDGCHDYDNGSAREKYMKLLCEAVVPGCTNSQNGDWYLKVYEPCVNRGGFYENQLISAASHLTSPKTLTSKGINNDSEDFWKRLGGSQDQAILAIEGVVILHFGNHFGVLTGYETEHAVWSWFRRETVQEKRFIYRDYHNEVQYEPLIDAITNGARIIY